MQVADYPHLKKEQRKQVYRRMSNLAYPETAEGETQNLSKIEDLVSFLRRNLGNG